MEEVTRVWRPRAFGRALALAYIAVFILAVVAGVLDLAMNEEPGIIAITLAGGIPLLLISVLGGLRPFIRADEEGVRIQNPVRRHDLAWAEIETVVAGYDGVEITTRGDDVVVGWAVQKSNLARWLRRRTRADDVAEFLAQAAKAAPGDPTGA